MQPTFDQAFRNSRLMMPPRIADPARGVGQALRTIYVPAKVHLPADLQTLLDRLDASGSDRP